MLRDPRELALPPREQALAGFSALLAEAPWSVDDGDRERLRAAGLSGEEIVHAAAIVGMFSHFTRMADATGIAPDYTSPLPRMTVDTTREPLPRPDPEAWREVTETKTKTRTETKTETRTGRLSIELLPAIAGALARWREYVLRETASLSGRDRAVLARAAAYALCDAAGVAEHADGAPGSPREATLAAFAQKLTVTPWRMQEADVLGLRRLGLDDRGVLQAIAVVGFQNQASRVRLGIG